MLFKYALSIFQKQNGKRKNEDRQKILMIMFTRRLRRAAIPIFSNHQKIQNEIRMCRYIYVVG